MIISTSELRKIEEALHSRLKEVEVSLDLGLSERKIKLGKDRFYIGEELVKIPKLRRDDKNCYVLVDGKLRKVQWIGEDTRFLYKLVPTSNKPILQVSGTSMHKKDFVIRVENEKLKGHVLDAGTGLGYTAIAASETADKVITVELDQNVIEMQKLNPWSKELFESNKIDARVGDIVVWLKKFKDDEFDYLILDGGTPKSSGDFFSLKNYKEAYRVLKKGGKLFHYLPKPQIKAGRDFAAECVKRMEKVGFKLVENNIEGSYAILEKV
ncbi:methyltransferase domain-containing protein [Candidatus Woesearchaeota archaeon]|nr:methyltransferase domain-containing protein [Candidatus Woesearchaeota archaeon]